MAFDLNQQLDLTAGGGGGSFGEVNAGKAKDYLRGLKQALDAGQISTKDYLAKAQPIAEFVNKEGFRLGGMGSKAASVGSSLQVDDLLKTAGFKRSDTDQYKLSSDLGQKYEQDSRAATLPDNLDPEARKKIISDIPTDINLNSDRGQIEREGIREATQQQQGLDQRDTLNKSRLSDLADILANRATQQFQRSIPQVAEDANSAGVFRSSGYGNALAQKQNEFTQDLTSQIGMQGIQDRNAYTGGLEDIQNNRIGNQQAGMSRQFSLDDFARDKNFAIAMAQANQPKQQGKTSAQKNEAYAGAALQGGQVAASSKSGGKKPA